MPSSAVSEIQAHNERRIDVVLGDRYAASCDPLIAATAEDCLRNAGLNVVRNRPYAGGFFTENQGHPRLGRHALQVEINRCLYTDEGRQTKTANFNAMKDILETLAHTLGTLLADQIPAVDFQMAAE